MRACEQDFFPELSKAGNPERVTALIKDEEESFNRTLENGLKEVRTRRDVAEQRGSVSADVFSRRACSSRSAPRTFPRAAPSPARWLRCCTTRSASRSTSPSSWRASGKAAPRLRLAALTNRHGACSGLVVDTVAYEQKMESLREIARNAGKTAESKLVLGPPELEVLSKEKIAPTDDSFKYDWVTVGHVRSAPSPLARPAAPRSLHGSRCAGS
jgi:hypothetical protein